MFDAILNSTIHWLDLIGVAVFAISGALEASRRQMDIVGFALIASVTGLGGGTIRDLLLDISPVSWVSNPMVIMICVSVAVVVFFTAHFFESRYRVLLWADAVGLALVCILGTEKALGAGAHPSIAMLMGVITATFGGMVRDIICNEIPLILRREVYAMAALAGAGIYTLMHAMEMDRSWSVIIAFCVALSIRAMAIIYGLSFPTYKARPGREV